MESSLAIPSDEDPISNTSQSPSTLSHALYISSNVQFPNSPILYARQTKKPLMCKINRLLFLKKNHIPTPNYYDGQATTYERKNVLNTGEFEQSS